MATTRAANGHHRSRLALRRRDRTHHLGMAAGRGSHSAAVSNRSWTTAEAAAARTAPADLGQDTRPQPAARGVANDYLARGNRGSSRFARRRVRPAHRDNSLSELRAEEWLLIEWPEDETEPTKYWFSTLPEDTAFDRLVD